MVVGAARERVYRYVLKINYLQLNYHVTCTQARLNLAGGFFTILLSSIIYTSWLIHSRTSVVNLANQGQDFLIVVWLLP